MRGTCFYFGWCAVLAAGARADVAVQFSIDLSKETKLISPLIYGSNDDSLTANDGVTFRRMGGNRLTGYNWENNASNAGLDYIHSSDSFLGGGLVPGKSMTDFHDKSVAAGQQSVITLPAAGYVSKDKKGVVSTAETAPSARWVKVVFEKGSAFSALPDTTDDAVYTDEFVAFMNGKYGDAASKNGVKRWEVDNEPALWPFTHPRIHPDQTGAAELVQKTTALATAVKKVDPQCEIFGGVFYGYAEYANMQSAKDWGTVNPSNKYAWYIDYFLDAMKKASDQAGKRLIDVLDIHWYPEAKGRARIIDDTATTAEDRAARVQAPRSLWDNTYKEKSWITQSGAPINLLPRIQASIDKYFPGTRIAITEYNYGEPAQITGGLAEADFLGVLASQGVYAAAIWPLTNKSPYVAAALRLYRNYDGQKGTFGSASAQATASSRDAASVFASFNPGGDEIHIIAINKSPTETVAGTFTVASPVPLADGIKAYGLDQSAAAVSAKAAATVSGNGFTYSLPPWSATHFVLKTTGALPPVSLRPVRLRPASMAPGSPAYLPDGRVFPPSRTQKAATIPIFLKP